VTDNQQESDAHDDKANVQNVTGVFIVVHEAPKNVGCKTDHEHKRHGHEHNANEKEWRHIGASITEKVKPTSPRGGDVGYYSWVE